MICDGKSFNQLGISHGIIYGKQTAVLLDTVKPICNDHRYNKIHYLWFIQ